MNPSSLSVDQQCLKARKRHAVRAVQAQYHDQWVNSLQHPHCGLCKMRGTLLLPKGFRSPYFHSIREQVEHQWGEDIGMYVTLRVWQNLWLLRLEETGWAWIPMRHIFQCPTCSHYPVPPSPQLSLF